MIERIRTWQRLGLIKPAEREHLGTGYHALFHPDTAYDVAFIAAISKAGIQIASFPEWDKALAVVRNLLVEWKRARRKGPVSRRLFINIAHYSDGKIVIDDRPDDISTQYISAAFVGTGALTADVYVAAVTSIDLAHPFEHVWKMAA
jgi:hypothetical protein